MAQKKLPEAILEYKRAVQIDGKYGEARLKLADALMAANDPGHAYGEYIRAADLMPDDEATQLKASGILLFAGKFDDAEARADKVLARHPNSVPGLIAKANALAGLHRTDEAVSEIKRAIEGDPTRSASYAWLGTVQLLGGRQDEAEAAFKKADFLEPKSIEPCTWPAVARFLLGDRTSACCRTGVQGGSSDRPEKPLRQLRAGRTCTSTCARPRKPNLTSEATSPMSGMRSAKLALGPTTT